MYRSLSDFCLEESRCVELSKLPRPLGFYGCDTREERENENIRILAMSLNHGGICSDRSLRSHDETGFIQRSDRRIVTGSRVGLLPQWR